MDELPNLAANQVASDLRSLHQYLRDELATTIAHCSEATASRRTAAPPFEVGQQVWLSTKNLRTLRPMKKLDDKRAGPFTISEIVSSHAVRLDLPPSLRIHNVFHVNLLEPASASKISGRIVPPPTPIEVPGGTEYEVSAIVDSRVTDEARMCSTGLNGRDIKGHQSNLHGNLFRIWKTQLTH